MTPQAAVVLMAARLAIAAFGAYLIERAPDAPVREMAPRVVVGLVLMLGSVIAL